MYRHSIILYRCNTWILIGIICYGNTLRFWHFRHKDIKVNIVFHVPVMAHQHDYFLHKCLVRTCYRERKSYTTLFPTKLIIVCLLIISYWLPWPLLYKIRARCRTVVLCVKKKSYWFIKYKANNMSTLLWQMILDIMDVSFVHWFQWA